MRDPTIQASSASSKIGRLKRRADFLRAAKGTRWHAGGMTLQTIPGDQDAAVRVGFTLTRKVGNAVVRNRIRRRLKEALRVSPDLPVRAGHDYVIIGRIEALRLPFESLRRELDLAVRSVHELGRTGRPRSKDKRPTRTKPAP